MLRDARRAIETRLGGSVSDDELVRELCRAALEPGAAAEGRAAYQVAVTLCEDCGRGWQDGAGDVIEVAAEVIDHARCDCDHIGSLDAEAPARMTADIPPATRRLIERRFLGKCAVPGCRSSRYLEIHHLRHREHGGDHDPDNLVLVCGAH